MYQVVIRGLVLDVETIEQVYQLLDIGLDNGYTVSVSDINEDE